MYVLTCVHVDMPTCIDGGNQPTLDWQPYVGLGFRFNNTGMFKAFRTYLDVYLPNQVHFFMTMFIEKLRELCHVPDH